jgi:hypothetical protein
MTDPTAGFFRFNAAIGSSPSVFVIDDVAFSPAVNLGQILDVALVFTWVKFVKKTDPNTYAYYQLDANGIPRTGYAEYQGNVIAYAGTWNNNDEFLVFFETAGSSGSSGASGAAGSSGTSGTAGSAGTSVSISGTNNTVVKFTGGGSSLGDSNITDDGTTVTVSTSKVKVATSLAVGNITPSGTTGRIDAANDVVAFSSSDARYKENVVRIGNALDKVLSIGGYEFDWKPEHKIHHGFEGHDVGVIAQEIEAILPEIVTTRDSGFKGVKYEKLVALLIEAIRELNEKVDKLK